MIETHTTNPVKHNVHRILAHSYSVFFLFFLVGVCLDLVFSLKVFHSSIAMYLGFVFLVLATFLVIWAQRTSHNLKKDNLTHETFRRGPYSFTRSPTHWGLFFLVFGFGLVTNAFFVILSAFISLIVAKLTFLDTQEKILEEKYGSHYTEYKKSVKF